MKTFAFALPALTLSLAFAFPSSPSFAADAPDTAANLVAAGRFDQIAFEGVRYYMDKGDDTADEKAAKTACLSSHGPALFTSVLASLLRNTLSEQDLQAALAFYSTPAIQKAADANLSVMRQQERTGEQVAAPKLSDEERRMSEDFIKSPAAKKLGETIRSPGYANTLRTTMVQTCGLKVSQASAR
jgi:hypothetical protein